MEVTITLPIETINACLAALVKFPYEQSQPHIELLRVRANEALAAQQKTAEPTED
jgi:hypothetical protein